MQLTVEDIESAAQHLGFDLLSPSVSRPSATPLDPCPYRPDPPDAKLQELGLRQDLYLPHMTVARRRWEWG